MRKLIELSLLVVGLPLLMGTEVYRWVDLDGIVNFAQLKPRGVQAEHIATGAAGLTVIAEKMDQLAGLPQGSESNKGPRLSPAQQDMLNDLQAAEQVRQNEIAKIKRANCNKSRNVLSRLSRADRIRVRDSTGSERIMGEDERQQRISDAHRGISENCTS